MPQYQNPSRARKFANWRGKDANIINTRLREFKDSKPVFDSVGVEIPKERLVKVLTPLGRVGEVLSVHEDGNILVAFGDTINSNPRLLPTEYFKSNQLKVIS